MRSDTMKALLGTLVAVALAFAYTACVNAAPNKVNTLGALMVGLGVLGVLAIMGLRR
jgi:hypothetical protein